MCSSDSGGISLRGHSKGVTDVMFSKHSPLLFTVSKDRTMRAWKSSDYLCGAVYRFANIFIILRRSANIPAGA